MNTPKIIRSYSQYAKLKYYKLQLIKLKFYHLLMLISEDIRLKVPKIAKRVPWFLVQMFIKTNKLSLNTVLKIVYRTIAF